ncbi:MAG: hypothetical protein ACFFDK_11660 [Promethearchaeota archaeon]
MNDRTKYIAGIQLILGNQLKNYNPRVISNLSKEVYEIYITRKNTVDKISKLLNEPNFNIEKFKKIINEQLMSAEESLKALSLNSKKTDLEIEIYRKILSI